MEFSLDWMRQYVDPGEDAAQIAERLTAAGLAVEGQKIRGGDVILDIDVTTNRPDCMNHVGIAREVAALTGRTLQMPSTGGTEVDKPTAEVAKVRVEDPVGCPRYVARVILGVEVGPSPAWLVERLASIGQRSINNIVDVTNFVLWELGQPIHAFDLGQLSEATIVVRRARPGERLTTLDGEERELDPEVLTIADNERVVALAGIMGGLDSEVTGTTVNILIESAHFDPTRVRLGARALGMHTDASHRFERGADPGVCRLAADRVAALVLEIAGGELLQGALDIINDELEWHLSGTLELQRAERFGGVELSPESVENGMRALGFAMQATGGGVWQVGVPTWRYYDMRANPNLPAGGEQPPVFEADFFEEVLRLAGFDRIPATLPEVGGPDAGSSAGYLKRQEARVHLAGSGYMEAITFAFHTSAADKRYPALLRSGEPLRLANPLSELYAVMRRSLLPGLVEAVRFNLNRGAGSIRLFEIGHVFPGGDSDEVEAITIIGGGGEGTPWDRRTEYDLFDLKGAVESLALRFGARLRFAGTDLEGFVPGTSAMVTLAEAPERTIGFLGQLAEHELAVPVYAAEIDSNALGWGDVQTLQLPSRYPAVEVDLTLTHDRQITWSEIETAIEQCASEELARFGLKDRYAGEGVPTGAVNTTIYFFYNANDRSLTQEEVNERLESVRQRLTEQFGWKGST